HDGVILLDQGPVFKLATLDAFGPERRNDPRFERWWHSMFERWASTLDLVIWLNAPTETLVQRINARQKGHKIKGKTDLEAHQFLACYQKSYEEILEKLARQGRTTMFPIDTSQRKLDQVVEEVLQSITSCFEDT